MDASALRVTLSRLSPLPGDRALTLRLTVPHPRWVIPLENLSDPTGNLGLQVLSFENVTHL